MQIRSRDLHKLKKLVLEFCVLNFFTGLIMLRPFNISLLCWPFFRYLKSKVGLVEKTVYFLK